MALPLSRAARVRVIPFAVFMGLLALRGGVPADGSWGIDPRWIYGITVVAVGSLLAAWWREYGELSWQNRPTAIEAGWAVGAGLLVFVLWISLTAPWMQVGEPTVETAEDQLHHDPRNRRWLAEEVHTASLDLLLHLGHHAVSAVPDGDHTGVVPHQVDQHRLVAAVRGSPGGPHQIAVELLEHAGAVAARGIGRHDITEAQARQERSHLRIMRPIGAHIDPDERSVRRQHVLILRGVRTGGVTIEDRCLHADAV